MTVRINCVVSVGRMSVNDLAARPVIEEVSGKFGGRVLGGLGSAQDPIVVEFAEKGAAVEAAKMLWYHDSIEAVTVQNVDNLATSTVVERIVAGEVDAVDAVVEGLDVTSAVDGIVAARLAADMFDEGEGEGGTDGTATVTESCNSNPADLAEVASLAAQLNGLVAKFGNAGNDTAAMFVQDAKAAADALNKIVASYPS